MFSLFLSPHELALWLMNNVFNNMTRTERRCWILTFLLVVIGLIGWMRAERTQ